MSEVFLRIVAALALAAPTGRADQTVAPPVARADHVVLKVDGKTIAGWPIDPDAKNGSILLTDDGVFVTVKRAPAPEVVATAARPVTEIPGPALVDGLAHSEESVRDRCQELVALRGAEAEPLLALALASKAAEARRRALVLLTRTPVVALAAPIKARVDDAEEGVRAVALEAYAKLKRADALRVCVEALQGDHSPLVQHSAAQQIGGLADLHGVDPLLDHLKLCDDRGVRIVIFAALRKISGKNYGRDEEAWRAWWTNHREELLPEEEH